MGGLLFPSGLSPPPPCPQNRRSTISLLAAGAAALTLKEQPALAAYGEVTLMRCSPVIPPPDRLPSLPIATILYIFSAIPHLLAPARPPLPTWPLPPLQSANVFGKATNTTGFVPYVGEGFSLLLPSKWNPSKEKDFELYGLTTALRYEDNFDAVNTLMVLKAKASGNSVKDYGSPEDFLKKYSFLLGQQAFEGDTISEGGFGRGRVAAASVLNVEEAQDKKGKPVYKYYIVQRTADGNEGGRHQLISATVANGELWIYKVQCGDKRWFKGVRNEAEGTFNSFIVA